MKDDSFTTKIIVEQTPEEAYRAINDVRAWWTGDITGSADRVGATFTYAHEDLHRSTQKVVEAVPGRRVVWQVDEAHLSFVDDHDEWNGTRIVFDIVGKGDKTEVRFTHEGLRRACACYDDCASAWTFYVGTSLRDLITKKGRRRA